LILFLSSTCFRKFRTTIFVALFVYWNDYCWTPSLYKRVNKYWYGSEMLGFKEYKCIEEVNTLACKNTFVWINKTNAFSLGKCCSYPHYSYSYVRCLNYLLKIINMPDTRYLKTCFNFLLDTNTDLHFI
jgi:hypothetical protein